MWNTQILREVLDGGMTESGQPYFVMELVQGLSLMEFCDQHHLSIRERLRVFLQVCRAVAHAPSERYHPSRSQADQCACRRD